MNQNINKIKRHAENKTSHAELVSAPHTSGDRLTGGIIEGSKRQLLKPIAALILLLILTITAHAQKGFVQQDIILQGGTTTDGQITQLSYTGKQTTRTYVDGLGRAIQNVAVQASPAHNDLIQPMAYDTLGRQVKGYLPYAGQSTDVVGSYRPNAISTDQPAFYNQTTQYLIATDADPYSQQVFDNSPLQRVLEAGQVGNGFQPVSGQHYKTVSYRYNTSTDAVWIWSNAGTHTLNNNYAANTLSVTDGTDEDGVECLVFADMAGRTILKRQVFSPANLDTYYIYNNSGMLIDIVPPKATAIMTGGNFSLSQSSIITLIFSYAYDNMGRLTQKIVPGNVALNYIYDPLNRPVLIQDANLAANYQWNYIKYDVKGRAVSQGIYTDPNHYSAAQMQSTVNGMSGYSTLWYESRSNTQTNHGYYTNSIFPSSNITPLAYEYYDNYTLTTGTTYSYHTSGLTPEPSATTAQIKGLPTMVQKSTVGSGLTTTWLISVTFYDHNLRSIQSQTNNLLYTTGGQNAVTDYKTSVLDFTGMPTVSLTSKKSSSTVTTTVQTTLTYDPVHRITAVDQSYNGLSTVHVAQYVYNELGQLVQKKLGETSTSWLQLVDFRYNIRGQLTNINNSTLTNDGHTDDDPDPVFGMTLLYEQSDSHLTTTPSYSGRISAVKWMSKDGSDVSSRERAFTYNYDAAARYTAANYAERTGSGSFNVTHGWDEQITGYDENGNIKTLTRNATTQGSGTYTAVDNLTYTYQTNNANQLYTVTDATNNQTGFGIQTGGNSGGHYVYDPNGNLTSDPYKDLSIGYNSINKTDKITMLGYTGRYEYYVYDATGTVMEKQQWDSNTLVHTTVYMDEFVYIDGAISYITTPEGRANYNGTTFTNEYIISDHQGNARISFNNTGTGGAREVVQENSYYGFGMVMPGSVVGLPTVPNKKLYNGQSEWQNDYSNMPDYYQTPGRNYDAEIGRFISADPMPESATDMSTYHFAGDNPIMMNDPSGNAAGTTGSLSRVYGENPSTNFWVGINNPELAQGDAVEAGGGTEFAQEQADFNGWVAGNEQYDSEVMRDQTADYSAFWKTALYVGNAVAQGLANSDQSGWHFSGAGFDALVGAVQGLKDNQAGLLFANNDGSTGWGIFTFVTTPHPSYSRNGNLMTGTILNITFTIAGASSVAYQWIQTVSRTPNKTDANGNTISNPFVDGTFRGSTTENYPFYLTQGDLENYNNEFFVHFHDEPGMTYQNGRFTAEATLVGIDASGHLTSMMSFNWGYSVYDGGDAFPFVTTPSVSQSDYTNKVISDKNSRP